MKILVTGATGTAGSEVVRQALLDHEIQLITALSRKSLSVQDSRLKTILHQNFLDYSALTEIFKTHDTCLWCLGISQTQVTKEQYEVITFNYAVSAAEAMLKANPSIQFIFLSGQGADSSEQSRTIFARIKGKTENALKREGFQQLYIARPAGIKPIHLNPNTSLANKIMAPFFPLLEFFAPKMVIGADELARAMLYLAKHGADKMILENQDLKRLGRINA